MRRWLDRQSPGHWIDCQGSVEWPVRSKVSGTHPTWFLRVEGEWRPWYTRWKDEIL